MNFIEWLLLNEIPHAAFPRAVSKYLPDGNREAKSYAFDSIDMHLELYMPMAKYRQFVLQGFNAKFPFDNDFVVFNAQSFRTTIGQANPTLPTLANNWYQYARFLDGNSTTYWAMKGIYEPTTMAVTA